MESKKFTGGIVFSSINVNTIDSLSAVSVGKNKQSNWFLSSKTNSGLGTIEGLDNAMHKSSNFIIDHDIIDSPTNLTADGPSGSLMQADKKSDYNNIEKSPGK